MKQTNRKELFSLVENVMTEYCKGCFVHQTIKKESGRRAAHRFCISQCTVGEQLRKVGDKLV